MRKKLLAIAVCGFLLLLLNSCATLFSGTSQKVKFNTYPEGAKIYVDGHFTGKYTPARLKVRRTVRAGSENSLNEHVYTFKKEGYKDVTVRDRRRVNGLALALDLPLLLPMIVDFANGSIYKYNRRWNLPMQVQEPEPEEVLVTTDSAIVVSRGPVQPLAPPAEADILKDIPETGIKNPEAIAVVIGNGRYENRDIPSVNFAHNDAGAVKQYLVKTFGFKEGNILMLKDASLADMNRTFGNRENFQARLFNLVKPGVSDVFVYYSGHGAPDPESEEGYLVTKDCGDISLVRFDGYPLNVLYNNLARIPYRSLTVVIDACFSGNSEGGMLVKNASPVYIKSKSLLFNSENAMVFTSSKGNQISSWFNEQGHSLFTYYFLRGLKGEANRDREQKVLSLLEMREYLMENVPYMARKLHNRSQTPEIAGDDRRPVLKLK